MTAITNAANAQLQMGGGVTGAIHTAAGPGLAKECRPMTPIKPGDAVFTGGHNLPNRFAIHCLRPVYGMDKPSASSIKFFRVVIVVASVHINYGYGNHPPRNNTIREGHSLWEIARRNQTTVSALCRLNRLNENSVLQVGMVLQFY